MESYEADYEERLADLRAYVQRFISRRKKSRWQCIVGVSGGKDSTRQALWVREKLGLNPLLVSVAYPPKQITENGVDNLSNLVELGFDLVVLGPAPQLSRELVKEAFLKFGNWCKATEMALFSGVPRIAVQKKIPLIFWGENAALQVGDMSTLGDSIWDGSKLRNSNTLQGGDLGWFLDVARRLDRLHCYKFPSEKEIKKSRVQTVFLGPAWKDWSCEANSRVSLAHGLNIRGGDELKTGDSLGTRMLDEEWVIVNFLLKYYKFGFARGTEEANVLIRQGLITREEGIKIAVRLDGACGQEYIDSFCEYIRIDEALFWETIKKFTNTELFDVSGPRPVRKFIIGEGLIDESGDLACA
jgi:N-acetyl sugar amidotransferase